MFDWFNKLPPFVQRIVSNAITGLILAGLAVLAAAGIYKPPVINVAPANVTATFALPEGAILSLPKSTAK